MIVEHGEIENSSLGVDQRRRNHYANIEAVFARDFDQLLRIARHLSFGVMDHDDLLSDVITASLAKATNLRPTTNVRAYLVASMRNRVIDELRSARRRDVTLLPEVAARLPSHSVPSLDEMDERALVIAALRLLPDTQRRYLIRTVVDGLKPRELVVEFGRPASALSSLAQRARVSFAQALLDVIIQRCTFAEHDASDLGCEGCRRTWDELALSYGGFGNSARRWEQARLA